MTHYSNGSLGHFPSNGAANHPSVGILQWFHLGNYKQVGQVLDDMKRIGIKELRTGISWADSHRPEGDDWFDWLIPTLSEQVNILPCFLYTPPSVGIKAKTSSPPRNPEEYAYFVDTFLKKYGRHFEWVELWNEPNNRSEYDYTLDNSWDVFSSMIIDAASRAKEQGKKTLLGGMSPVDPNWLEMMIKKGALKDIDAVGIHGFPDVFDTFWEDWSAPLAQVQAVLDKYKLDKEIWITEAGYSTWRHDERRQLKEFMKVIKAPAPRIYWYSLNDLSPHLPTVDGLYLDEREYFFGLKKHDGTPKLLYRLLRENGLEKIENNKWIFAPVVHTKKKKGTLITGGAGFVGINLAHRLLTAGRNVIILDNLSRPGVEKNLQWLQSIHPDTLHFEVVDIRNEHEVNLAVEKADMVYHLAAQVAVTTSLENPKEDFEINVKGTINVLEAIRKCKNPPPLIYTSTNKVYGNLGNIALKKNEYRWEPADPYIAENGISEDQNLSFHSPYGSSKGAAEQYVLDYTRSFGIKSVVFRMSCIYGPRQYGNEDQGWVAHFMRSALQGEDITIYGDGKQVRDILYIDDLTEAFLIAEEKMEALSGNAFNIGGGVNNVTSILEFLHGIELIYNTKLKKEFSEFRTGDQYYYVSDVSKFSTLTGWKPKTPVPEGMQRLYSWLLNSQGIYEEEHAHSEKS